MAVKRFPIYTFIYLVAKILVEWLTEKIYRKYLEITSLDQLKEVKKPSSNYSVNLLNPKDFQLNKFLYKQIGKKYNWKDRLIWTDKNWIDFISSKNLKTYVLKNNQDLVGYFELILHFEKNEVEIAYFGILEEYFEKNAVRYGWTLEQLESLLKQHGYKFEHNIEEERIYIPA